MNPWEPLPGPLQVRAGPPDILDGPLVRAMPKLTERLISRLMCPPGKKDCWAFDSVTRGYAVRVTQARSKVLYAVWTGAGRTKRRVKLGLWGVLTVEAGRRQAMRVLGEAAAGRDPVAETKAKAEDARHTRIEAAFTVERLISDWAKARAGDRRPSYLSEAVACCHRYLPDLLTRPAASMTKLEAVRAINSVKSSDQRRPRQQNLSLSAVPPTPGASGSSGLAITHFAAYPAPVASRPESGSWNQKSLARSGEPAMG